MKRILWIDRAKGFAMICVVLGHAITGVIRQNNQILNFIYNFIYTFHMPLFFMLSGYLFQKGLAKYERNGIRNFLYTKAKFLLIPYFSYSAITYTGVYIGSRIPYVGDILSRSGFQITDLCTSLTQVVFWQNSLDRHLWFIYCLFCIYLLSIVFMRSSEKKNQILYLFAAYVIYILFLKTDIAILQRVSNYLIYFVIGRFCCSTNALPRVRQYVNTPTIIGITVFLYVIRMFMINILFKNYLFTSLKASFNIFPTLLLCYLLYLLFNLSLPNPVVNVLNFVYKYNFEIYILHQPFIVSGTVMLLTALLGENFATDMFVILFTTTAAIVISSLLARIIHANPVTSLLLFGK